MSDANEVLAELKSVGAVGGLGQTFEIPRLVPRAPVIQNPTPLRVGALNEAVRCLDAAIAELGKVREVLDRLQEEQSEEDEDENEAEVKEPEIEESASGPTVDLRKDELAYQNAREAVLRKIRGDDIPEESGTTDSEENVPFVGQVEARPPDAGSEEITVGTVGTIAPPTPSFPKKES